MAAAIVAGTKHSDVERYTFCSKPNCALPQDKCRHPGVILTPRDKAFLLWSLDFPELASRHPYSKERMWRCFLERHLGNQSSVRIWTCVHHLLLPLEEDADVVHVEERA